MTSSNGEPEPGLDRDRIRHVIVLMMENRSFDHLLGFLPHPSPDYPHLARLDVSCPVDPADPDSERIPPTPDATPVLGADPDHSHEAAMLQLYGGAGETDPAPMNGFIRSFALKLAGTPPTRPRSVASRVLKWVLDTVVALWHLIKPPPMPEVPEPETVMRCFPEDQAPVLSALAKEFAVMVNWHASVPGETWPNRNFAHAATSDGTTNIEIRFYDDVTIFEQLTEQGATWRIYHDGPAQVWAFWRLWFGDRTHFEDNATLLDDIRDDKLPAYAFVEPNHGILGGPGNSQHPGSNTTSGDSFLGGEELMADIYNALVDNPAVFAKTLLLITYDEHGGFFDHVPPQQVATLPGNDTFDFGITGVRVPAVAISPLIPKGFIGDDFYEHASIPKTVRTQFANAADPLTKRDAAATDLLATLPLLPTARTDCPRIDPPRRSLVAVPDPEDRKLNDFQASLLELAGAVKTQLEQPTLREATTRPPFQPDPTLAEAAAEHTLTEPARQALEHVRLMFTSQGAPGAP